MNSSQNVVSKGPPALSNKSGLTQAYLWALSQFISLYSHLLQRHPRHPLSLSVCTLTSQSALSRKSAEVKQALEAGLGLWSKEMQYPEFPEGISKGRASSGIGPGRYIACGLLAPWEGRASCPVLRAQVCSWSAEGRRLNCSMSSVSFKSWDRERGAEESGARGKKPTILMPPSDATTAHYSVLLHPGGTQQKEGEAGKEESRHSPTAGGCLL